MIQLPFLHEKIDNGSILLEHYEVKEAVANGYVCHRRDHDADYLLKPVAANLDKQDAQELQQNASKLSEILIHQNIAHILLAAKDEKTAEKYAKKRGLWRPGTIVKPIKI